MSLFAATLLAGLLLLLAGSLLLWNGAPLERLAKQSLRSLPATVFTMGLGSGWFLYHIAHLGEADFGKYKVLLFLFFLTIAVSSFFHVRDFLAVRGAAILALMAAKVFLDAAYMQAPQSRLFMVGFIYLCIVLALYLGTVPFKLRTFFDWLFACRGRARGLGMAFVLYGFFLCGVAFSY